MRAAIGWNSYRYQQVTSRNKRSPCRPQPRQGQDTGAALPLPAGPTLAVTGRNQPLPAPATWGRVQSEGSSSGRTSLEKVQGGLLLRVRTEGALAGAPEALLESLLVWSHLQKQWCRHVQGHKQKDFWVPEKVTREELRLWSLESSEGGRAEGRCQGYGVKVMFAEEERRRNHPAEPGRFGPYTAGSFLALRTPP